MKNSMKLFAVLLVLQVSSVAMAQENQTWTNNAGGGDQDWFSGVNWAGSAGAAVPVSGDTAFLNGQAGGNAAIVGILGSPTTATVGRMVFGTIGGVTGALQINDGFELVVETQSLAGNSFGEGGDIVVDGTYTVGTEFAFGNTQGTGTLTVGANGTVNANGDWLLLSHLGTASSGTGTVNGGTINVAGFMGVGWQGTGLLTVNSGGLVNVTGIMNLGVDNAAAHGDIVINSGEVVSAGFNLGNNLGSGTLKIEAAGKYTNNGGLLQTAGSAVTVNGTGEFIHADPASILAGTTLEDVRGLVFGNADWVFSAAPKITENLDGSVTITNTDGTELAGDFDFDGDVDGADFLEWQHGHSLNPFSPADLLAWETNYGMVAPAVGGGGAAVGVPEPTTALLFGGFCLLGSFALRRRRTNFLS